MSPLLISAVMIAAQVNGPGIARPGPCSAELAIIEHQIAHPKDGPLAGPTIAQTVAAQLHRQPTVQTVKRAERHASTEFQAAITRARTANAAGNVAACTQALNKAKDLYGIF